MKKYLILLLIIPLQLVAQDLPFNDQYPAQAERSLIPIYDSIHFFTYDTTNLEFGLDGKITDIVYNGTRKVSQLQHKLVNGSWQYLYFFRYFYSASGDADTTVRTKYSNGDWGNDYRSIRTLNAENKELSKVQQYWSNYVWRNSGASYHEYNDQGNVTSLTYMSPDVNGVLVESTRYLTTYYLGYLTHTKIRQSWEDGNWVDEFRTVHDYIDNRRDSSWYQYWIDGEWQTDHSEKYIYDEENQLDTIYSFNQGFDNNEITAYEYTDEYTETTITEKIGGVWENKNKIRYKYNGNYLLFDYDWEWQNDQWKILAVYHFTYDQGFISGDSYMSYHGYVEGDSTHNYFHTVVGRKEISATNFQVYPNPTTGRFSIAPAEQIQKIEIFNNQGSLVKTMHYSAGTYDISSCPAGFYFVKIHLKEGVLTAKVLKL